MYLLDIIPLTRIPHPQPQLLSYFSAQKLSSGALVKIPLGRRQEEGVVLNSHDIASRKMEIKSANFELRNITKIISAEPVLTRQQIELTLFLGQYYLCSPGIFVKMGLPPKITPASHSDPATAGEESRANERPRNTTLIIVPTISRAYADYKSYAPDNVVLWHSELTQKQKNDVWQKVKASQVKTIIGTRSAVFLPFIGLREIIIIDPDNPNHKSWDMFPHYDSRMAAQKLTKLFNCKIKELGHPDPAVAGEGSPAYAGRHKLEDSSPEFTPHLDAGTRNDKNTRPIIIDMRQELKSGNFSIFGIALYDAVKQALADKKQIILFINRRGAANFILCRDCGQVIKCPNCDAPMALHSVNGKPMLLCHRCGQKDTPPGRCPNCHSLRIKTVGAGSQKVETEAKNFFPDAKLARLDSDIAPKPKDQAKIVSGFVDKKTDLLIATPVIFSWLTELTAAQPAMVGLLSADTLLHIPDYRSGERTWQTIAALRSLGAKETIIQTYNPDNSIMKYAATNDYAGFIKEDRETREALNYPPFSQLVKLTFRHRDAKKAGQEAKIMAAKLKHTIFSSVIPAKAGIQAQNTDLGSRVKPGMTSSTDTANIEISDALPAFLPREKGKYAWNIIIKFLPYESTPLTQRGAGGLNKIFTIPDFLQNRNSLLQYIPSYWEVDVDPENLL